MKQELFINILNRLDYMSISIDEIYNEYLGNSVSYEEAEQFFYSTDRRKRFELFIALYEASLKNNVQEAFRAFREAYCASDNIYIQIKNSKYPFNLKDYISSLQKQNFNFFDLMSIDEKSYYESLPETLTIYRGMNNIEHERHDYCISWTLSKEDAENYSYFSENNVPNKEGGLAQIEIDRKDIITIFSVHEKKEIIYIKV